MGYAAVCITTAIVCTPCVHATGLLSSFQAGTGDWHLGAPTVGNVDGSPYPAIVIPYRDNSGQWYLDAYKWNGTRLPGFPYHDPNNGVINASPTLYDLTGDGTNKIIFTCGTSIIAMRGNGTILWSNQINRLNYIPNAGYQSTTNGFYWYPSGAWIANLPTTAVFYSEVSPPIIADVAGTGMKEVITAWKINPDSTGAGQDYNPAIQPIWGYGPWGATGENWSGGVVFHNATNGAQRFVYHFHHLVESGVGLGHADTNKPWEVYVLNDSDSVVAFDKTQPFGLFGKGMLHGEFGKNQQLITGSYQQPVDIYPADVNGDGLAELLVPMTQLNPFHQPGDTILDDKGAIMWRGWKQSVNFTNNHGWLNSACMIPVNPDHDNHVDVLTFSHSFQISYRYWNGTELVDHPGWPKDFSPLLPTPPVVGDVDGDGQQEIIIGTYDPVAVPSSGNLHIFALDGTEKQRIAVPGGIKHIISLADVNNDGSLDVVYRSTLGVVYVQNFGATDATNVSWATHRGNAQLEGKAFLSLYPPGTPLITSKTSGYHKTSFTWGGPATNMALAYRIYRANQATGPFTSIASLAPSVTAYTDAGLQPGWQYFYEVAAVIGTNEVHSAPFAILSFLNNNLLGNGGFEEDDNSHWDKWFSGKISWTNMIASTNVVYQGKQSMQVQLVNMDSESSMNQANQYGVPDGSILVNPGGLYSFGGFFCSGGLTQPSEHWFEWGSTPTAYDTNVRPALPFPNYFTPHFVIGTAPTGWAYANRTFIVPAGFPNLELRHRYQLDGTGNANGSIYFDNVFIRPMPMPNDTNWLTLFPFGSTWKFFTATPPTNWFAPTFNDNAWTLGIGKLGAGSGPTNIATPLPQFKSAYYFRKQFVLTNPACEEFLLSATCTDNNAGPSLEMYINGRQIVATDINCVSLQGNQVLYYDLTPFIDYLVPGTNTVAVILHNTYTSWDDVAFDLSMQVTAAPAASQKPRVNSVVNNGTAMTLGVTAPVGTIWQVQSSDTSPMTWQFMDVLTITSTGVNYIRDVGQNGRLAPQLVSHRFYRVVPY